MMRPSIVMNNIKIYVDLKENGTEMAVVQLQRQRETPERRTPSCGLCVHRASIL